MPTTLFCVQLESATAAVYVPPLLGAHNTRHLLCAIIPWAGEVASTAVSLNMVQQSTVVVGCPSYYCFRILVHADKRGSTVVLVYSHQPPAVLHCPRIRTGVPSRDHDLLGAIGHFTHSTWSVVLVQARKCLPTFYLILCAIQPGFICIGSCSFRVVLDIISIYCADVIGSSTYVKETACGNASINELCSSNIWACCLPPADIGRSS